MFGYHQYNMTVVEIVVVFTGVGCIPDDQMGDLIIKRFGKSSYVMKRYQRMMYWMPKFRSMNPYPIPWILPESVSGEVYPTLHIPEP